MSPNNAPVQYQIELERTANQPVSEGIHLFTIKSGEESESQAGNPMWVFTLACNTPGEEGKEVRFFAVLSQSARWKFELFLDAMNAPKTGSATITQFIGRQLRAQITHEDYEGRPQARIGEMFPVNSAPAARPAAASNPAVKKVTAGAPVVTKTAPAPVKKVSKGLPSDATE